MRTKNSTQSICYVSMFSISVINTCTYIWMVALMGDSIHISLTILNCIYLWYKRKHIHRHKTYVHTLFCMVLLRKNQNSVGFVAVQNKTQLTIRTSNDFGLVNGTDDVYVKIVIGCILSEFSQENNITNVLYCTHQIGDENMLNAKLLPYDLISTIQSTFIHELRFYIFIILHTMYTLLSKYKQ